MADLRVISTGKEFRRVDNATALLLEELFPENLERINAPATNQHADQAVNTKIANYSVPTWEIAMDRMKKPYVQLLIGSTEYIYVADWRGAGREEYELLARLPRALCAAKYLAWPRARLQNSKCDS